MPGSWLRLLHREDLIGRDVPQGLNDSARPDDLDLFDSFEPSETEMDAAGARRCIPYARRDVAALSAGPHARAAPAAARETQESEPARISDVAKKALPLVAKERERFAGERRHHDVRKSIPVVVAEIGAHARDGPPVVIDRDARAQTDFLEGAV